MSELPIAFYSIYGERDDTVDPGFIHAERVSDRRALHYGHVMPHRHPHLHQLSLWQNGNGVYHVDGNSHLLKDTMLSWIPSGTVHGFTIQGACDAIVVSISDEFLRDNLMGILPAKGALNWREPALVPLDAATAKRMAGLLGAVLEEYARAAPHHLEAMSALVKLAFIAFARLGALHELAREPQSEDWLLYRRFRSLLDRRGEDVRTIATLARDLGTTPYLLNKAVRAATGMKPAAIVRQHYLMEAKRLLLFTEFSAADIGYSLGFGDPAHFGRQFRREVGLSPLSWRRQRRSEMTTGTHAIDPPAK